MNNLKKNLSLESKNILVTGATGYLGSAISYGLADIGARVFINGRNRNRVEKVVRELNELGYLATPAVFDVNDEQSVRSWFLQFGDPLHGLVNNAYAGGAGTIEIAREEDYRTSFEISIVASHRLLQCALPFMRLAVKETTNSALVNIGSMYGIVSPDIRLYDSKGLANPPFYGASKAALLQWTRYAACEFGPEGIRVNAISPGPFPSSEVQTANPEFIDKLSKKVPLGRVGGAEEIQGAVAFLLSDASTFVNGTNLVVDGGWTCW